MLKTKGCSYCTYYILTYLFALFTTFEVFKTDFGGFTILYADFFYLLFVGYTVLLFFYRRSQLWIQNSTLYLLCIFFLLVLSTLNALPAIIDVSFDPPLMDGHENAVKYVVRNLFQLVIYILICFIQPFFQKQAIKGFCYGFLSAVIVHSIYSIIQMIFMYFFFEDIHTMILNSIGITKETIHHELVNYIGYPIFRNCGFHWDPAYYGLWGCIGLTTLLFSRVKKFWYKYVLAIVAVAWAFSFSRSGYFAFICCLVFMILGYHFNSTIRKVDLKKICLYSIYVCIGILVVFIFLPPELQDYIIGSFKYRFTYNPDSKGTSRHLLYPLWSIEGSLHDVWHFIFGYGPRNSSRGIAYGGNILDLTTNRVYDIESDLCKMLLSYGVIGLILYLLFNYYVVKYYVKNVDFRTNPIISYFYIFGIIGSFFAGIFYMYNDSKWVWFMYFFAILFLNNSTGKQCVKSQLL